MKLYQLKISTISKKRKRFKFYNIIEKKYNALILRIISDSSEGSELLRYAIITEQDSTQQVNCFWVFKLGKGRETTIQAEVSALLNHLIAFNKCL